MSGSDPSWGEAINWFAMAELDIRTARLCSAESEELTGVAAYHCQQAAEKVLKGLLVASGVPYRKTHELDELVTAVLPYYPELAGMLDPLRPLSYWSWAFRYPTLDPFDAVPPTSIEIGGIVEHLEKILTFLRDICR